MNTHRRHLLHLAALSTTAWALPGQGLAAVTERSGSPDRKVTHKAFWSNNLSCDNAAVPLSQQGCQRHFKSDPLGVRQKSWTG
jgi:hypothetical protein